MGREHGEEVEFESTMSVLVGAANKSSFPRSTGSSFKSDRNPSTGEPGTSGDEFVVTSPDTLLRQLSREGSLGAHRGEGFVEASSPPENLSRQHSKSSLCDSEEGEGQEENPEKDSFVVSPLVPLKDQLEKDKDDESLRRWKEQLLGSVQLDPAGGEVNPEVRVLSFSILSAGRADITIPLPLPSNTKTHLFTLKEGSSYNVKLIFTVRCNIVSGLRYIHTVWRNGFRVDKTRVMLGTFGPQSEAYSYVMEEETTPSGLLARGNYTARTRVIDDDGHSYLDIQHTFDIRKDW